MVKEVLKLLRSFGLALRLFCEVSDMYIMVPIYLKHCIPIGTLKYTLLFNVVKKILKFLISCFLARCKILFAISETL